MAEAPVTGLLGATSLVGECAVPLLTRAGGRVVAFSRQPPAGDARPGVSWMQPGLPSGAAGVPRITHWLCVAPLWVLPDYFPMLERHGATRIVALSSTSRFTKEASPDATESAIASRLAESERRVREWAESRGVGWTLLRPTLIYGRGRDKNVASIARFVKRFGFFPVLGRAEGLRQPVHAEDVAGACVAALGAPQAVNRAYDLSGGETLPYCEMVHRVFAALQRRPRLVRFPLLFFRMAAAGMRLFPRHRHVSAAMAERMSADLVFDHADAARDLGFSPRPFRLAAQDLPDPSQESSPRRE